MAIPYFPIAELLIGPCSLVLGLIQINMWPESNKPRANISVSEGPVFVEKWLKLI